MPQIGPDNKEHPVRYASRALQPPESKWTTREQELLAVIWACETFHRYLWGRKFFIQTDHANLQWLQAVSPQKSRLARWAMRLAKYDFELQHRSGKNNGNADALSRCPITSCAASTDTTSSVDVDNLIAVKTLAVFEASFAVEVDLSSNPNSQLSSSATEPESDDELDPDHLIALKPSLSEFRDEQRACPELHPIIECFLEPSSENSKKQGKFPG